jgi:hypothetical protein
MRPPQTIIVVPVHTAEWNWRPAGAFAVDVGCHELATGS